MLKAKDFRDIAWQKKTGKWGLLALITLVFEAILGACGGLSSFGVGAIALLLIEGPFVVGYSIVALNVVRDREVKFEQIFDGFKNFVNAFLLGLINTIFIALWSILFVIPGIVKSYSYSMSYFILAENPEMKPNDARKASMTLMKGNKWRLFCLDFSFIGWWILCLITCGILTFWILPYVEAAHAAFYESVKTPVAAAPTESAAAISAAPAEETTDRESSSQGPKAE